MMKTTRNRFTKRFVILAAFATLGLSAYGVPTIVLEPGLLTENPQQQGGEFTATSSTLSNSSYAATAKTGSITGLGGSFETFCMAYDQEFSYGDVLGYTLANATSDPGAGSIQALTKGTAWLYSQFASGNIVLGSGADDTAFQDAIWWFQNSAGAPSVGPQNPGNVYETLAVAQFGLAGVAQAAGASNYGVSIIVTQYDNSDGSFNRYSQPQLYYRVPDGGATVALLGLGFLGLVGFRKKFAK
jgi:hypothetical protein